MRDLKKITKLVEKILESDEYSRGNENYLYFRVCSEIAKKIGVDLNSYSMPRFLLMNDSPFPKFESVRRARQKLQASREDLRPNEDIQGKRGFREIEFRDYARH